MKSYLKIPNRQKDEELIFLLRRHWLTFARRLVLFILLFLAPMVVLFIARTQITETITEQEIAGVLTIMTTSLYYLYLGLYFFHAWLDYYLDVWIVTTRRIVNIEQHGLFSRIVSELHLDSVQDVTVEVHGVFPTIFKYGDVHVQTAAETARFLFDDIRRPYDVARKIIQLRDSVVYEKDEQPTKPADKGKQPEQAAQPEHDDPKAA